MNQVNEEQNLGDAVVDRKTEQGWQPIETAPRGQQWCVVGKISNGALLWWYRAMFWRGGWHASRSYDTRVIPSHWLPLPDPSGVVESAKRPISDRGTDGQAS